MTSQFEGFEYVEQVYLQEPYYDFNVLGIWKKEDGYYIGTDSGCSCPSPFESYEASDLTGPLTTEQVREEATSLWDGYEPDEFNAVMEAL